MRGPVGAWRAGLHDARAAHKPGTAEPAPRARRGRSPVRRGGRSRTPGRQNSRPSVTGTTWIDWVSITPPLDV